MRGSAILRDLRRLSQLPLRREAVYHLALNPDGPEPPMLNRLLASDPALAIAGLRAMPRGFRENYPAIPQMARFLSRSALFRLLDGSLSDRMPLNPVYDRVWTHSVAMAHAVRELSRLRRYEHSQSAFLAGLLHNLGLLAMSLVAPDAVQLLLDLPRGTNLIAEERKRFGTTHPTVGGQLAKRWGLPAWVFGAIRWHHQAVAGDRLADPALVALIREADEALDQTEYSFLSGREMAPPERVIKRSDPVRYCVVAGVRQTLGFLSSHPFGADAPQGSDGWVWQMANLAAKNAALTAELEWQSRAWENYRKVPSDATPADLTAVIAETFYDACNSMAVLCYVRNADGTLAEGTFASEGARTITCSLQPGAAKPHAEQVVAQLRATWQQRPYRVIDLERSEEVVAHVLLWTDASVPAPADGTMDAARSLCECWLDRVMHVSELDMQVDSLEEAIRSQAAESAQQLEQAKLAALAELAAGAGHEMNNPLAVISGRAQLLLAEETDQRRRKSLETIIAQTQRVHRMIVDLMLFARPPAADLKPMALGDAVQRAVASIQKDADRLTVAVTSSLPADLPPVQGDVTQLASAIECILLNALEATPENGRIEISAELSQGAVQLKVRDTGRGISDEQRKHIFEPFYSGRDAGRGLGMGLPKAWSIVQNHQGEIVVAAVPAGGTVVTIRLPALSSDAAQRACA